MYRTQPSHLDPPRPPGVGLALLFPVRKSSVVAGLGGDSGNEDVADRDGRLPDAFHEALAQLLHRGLTHPRLGQLLGLRERRLAGRTRRLPGLGAVSELGREACVCAELVPRLRLEALEVRQSAGYDVLGLGAVLGDLLLDQPQESFGRLRDLGRLGVTIPVAVSAHDFLVSPFVVASIYVLCRGKENASFTLSFPRQKAKSKFCKERINSQTYHNNKLLSIRSTCPHFLLGSLFEMWYTNYVHWFFLNLPKKSSS